MILFIIFFSLYTNIKVVEKDYALKKFIRKETIKINEKIENVNIENLHEKFANINIDEQIINKI
jgi:hypothetical protein